MKVLFASLTTTIDIRVQKEIKTLLARGLDVSFVGVKRKGIPNPIVDLRIKVFLPKTIFPTGLKLLFYLPIVVIHLLASIIMQRPNVIHCINEEVGLICGIFNLFRRRHSITICDVYDSVGLRIANPFFRWLGSFVADLSYRVSSSIIVTDENRKKLISPRYAKKVYVVPNYPRSEELDFAEEFPEGKTKVLCPGGLSASRGIFQLLRACEEIGDVEIWAAGAITSNSVKSKLLKSKLINYLGYLEHKDLLKIGSRCDAVFAFYKPSTPNNVYASPTRVYDALLLGRPIIINSETIISKFIVNSGFGYSCPYGDNPALVETIRSLRDKREVLRADSQRLRKIGKEKYSWYIAEKSLLMAYADSGICTASPAQNNHK